MSCFTYHRAWRSSDLSEVQFGCSIIKKELEEKNHYLFLVLKLNIAAKQVTRHYTYIL